MPLQNPTKLGPDQHSALYGTLLSLHTGDKAALDAEANARGLASVTELREAYLQVQEWTRRAQHLRESSWNRTCMNAQDALSSGAAWDALLAQKSASAALSLLMTACSKLPDCSTRFFSVTTYAHMPTN